MNIVFAFLPILIVITGLVFVFFIKNNRKTKMSLSSNLIIKLFSIYLVVVLAATIVYYFIPSSAFTDAEPFEQSGDYVPRDSDFFNAVHEGRIDDIDEKYVYDRFEFDYDNEQLDVVPGINDDYLAAQVLVERKEVSDGTIEVIHYVTPTNIDEYELDIPELDEKHRITLDQGLLRVVRPAPIEFHVTKFENEFVIRQFTGEKQMGMNLGSHEIIGSEVIYLRIPQDLTISGEIFMIEE